MTKKKDPWHKVVAAIRDVVDLPPNFGVVVLTWDQMNNDINSESNLPPDYVAALLTSWLEKLPPPAPMNFYNKEN